MKCSAPFCKGISFELHCTEHGEMCSECGIPTYHHRSDKRCAMCGARADGEVCVCTSPWVYMPFYEDDKWRCRSCVLTLIRDRGWDEDVPQLLAAMKDLEEQRKTQEATKEVERDKEREIQGRMKKARKQRQDENLF